MSLKKVYQAFTKEEAEFELDKLEEKWGKNTLSYLNLGEISGIIYLTILSIQSLLEKSFTPQYHRISSSPIQNFD